MEEALAKLRQIRTTKDPKLKPSPYLRTCYFDEYGDERPVRIRDYQVQGVMNLLLMERFLLGDDCGLGKTLEVLTALGYIWMQEPEYIPIVVTTKSALFQWRAEVERFMQGMEAVTVFGEPFRRHDAYEEFFLQPNAGRKRLLLLTYDMIMYDMEATVIRNKGKSPRKGFMQELKQAKAAARDLLSIFEEIKASTKERLIAESWEIQQYARYLCHTLHEQPDNIPSEAPQLWMPEHRELVDRLISARHAADQAKALAATLTAEWAPPRQVSGLIDYLKERKVQDKCTKIVLILDEVHKLKNHRSQFHQKTAQLAAESDRVIGMTATPVENRLMEFFSIFRIIRPGLFPKVTHFQRDFCVMKMQKISNGRQVPIVVGYRNLDEFCKQIEPYYLSRKKHEVAEQLPDLLCREIDCELSEEQEELYGMAEAGVDELGSGDSDDEPTVLKALTLCQQAADAPGLILDTEGNPFEGPSSKIETLLDLLDGEAAGQKVIVFSKFEKMISIVDRELVKSKIKYTRITGKENSPKLRQCNREQFQDPRSGVNVILITTAGAESLNLQTAEHFVFLDLPWSWGKYVQLLGRMVRIGSVKTTVVAHHLLSRRRNGEKTIDHHVLKALRLKKGLADKVAGEALRGGLKFVQNDVILDVLALMSQGTTNELRTISRAAAAKAATKGKHRLANIESKSKSKSKPDQLVECFVGPDMSDLLS
jgi:SNF2 family DNA or RNA helicase